MSFLPHTPRPVQNWVVEFNKWLPDREQEETKKKNGGSNKPSRTRNKKSSQQNGRCSKILDNLSSSSLYPSPSNSLPATNNVVTMPTSTVAGGNNISSQVFVGGSGALSESDQQLLLGLMSSDPATGSAGGHAQTTPTTLGVTPLGSRPHTPSQPGVSNSRSHTASPNTPEIQYRSFKLYVLSETYRSMESRLRLIKQWREDGEEREGENEVWVLLSNNDDDDQVLL